MLSSSTNVQKVGPATINGVPTTEYTGTYPVSAALAKLPAVTRSTIAAQLKTLGLTTEHFAVWLDDQQQVRKIVTTEKGSSVQVATTIVVTSVNQPVRAAIPPAAADHETARQRTGRDRRTASRLSGRQAELGRDHRDQGAEGTAPVADRVLGLRGSARPWSCAPPSGTKIGS